MRKHLRIIVQGRVQGVGFRYSVREEAERLGLSGSVQNLSDGSVEIHAEGEEKRLHDFLAWCQKGPAHANVQKVDYKELPLQSCPDFQIV